MNTILIEFADGHKMTTSLNFFYKIEIALFIWFQHLWSIQDSWFLFPLFLMCGLPFAFLEAVCPTKDAPDLGDSSVSDSESKPAPKRVI